VIAWITSWLKLALRAVYRTEKQAKRDVLKLIVPVNFFVSPFKEW